MQKAGTLVALLFVLACSVEIDCAYQVISFLS